MDREGKAWPAINQRNRRWASALRNVPLDEVDEADEADDFAWRRSGVRRSMTASGPTRGSTSPRSSTAETLIGRAGTGSATVGTR